MPAPDSVLGLFHPFLRQRLYGKHFARFGPVSVWAILNPCPLARDHFFCPSNGSSIACKKKYIFTERTQKAVMSTYRWALSLFSLTCLQQSILWQAEPIWRNCVINVCTSYEWESRTSSIIARITHVSCNVYVTRQRKSRLLASERTSFSLAAQAALEVYGRIISKLLVQRDVRSILPSASNHFYYPGDFTYVYREGLKQFSGPHLMASVHGTYVQPYLEEWTGPRAFNNALSRLAPVQICPTYDEKLSLIESILISVRQSETSRTGNFRKVQ